MGVHGEVWPTTFPKLAGQREVPDAVGSRKTDDTDTKVRFYV